MTSPSFLRCRVVATLNVPLLLLLLFGNSLTTIDRGRVAAFSFVLPRRRSSVVRSVRLFEQRSGVVEWQADHGRGTEHLSYSLEDGDVVVYQTGTWYVDTVEVGDGTPPAWNYCRVGDHSQIVFTHDCEHGVVRGWRAVPFVDENEDENEDDSGRATPTYFRSTEEDVEFGPEQLVARIPVDWDEEEKTAVCTSSSPLPESWCRE